MMELSPETSAALASLQTFSGGKLTRRPDLGILMELARSGDLAKTLDELSFHAKFLHRTFGIMKRIGKDANGYDKLSSEFSVNTEKAMEMLRELLAPAPEAIRGRFTREYLAMTPEAFVAFMGLLYDLSWYKNWLIDHHGENA